MKRTNHFRAKKWKILFLCLFLLGIVSGVTGCSGRDETVEISEETKEQKLQIGMSFDSFVIERWLRDRDLFVATARELGAEVNVQVANGDAEEQIAQIEYFIQKKMDVIVIISVDGDRLTDVVKKARKEGIKVISYDRLVKNADTDLYISFDNEMVGRLMAEAMVEALPNGGNIFEIQGSPVDYNVESVNRGFHEVIEQHPFQIVYTAYCENWLAELAFDAVEEGLNKNPRNIVGVMCGNDDLASQAFRALAVNRLAGKVVLVGQDAELAACQRIVEGVQTMTVYKRVEDLASKAAGFACALGYNKWIAEGKCQASDLPKKLIPLQEELTGLSTFPDGTYEVPYYAIEPVAVTKENMDEIIIGDDFHTKEDVYLNVE